MRNPSQQSSTSAVEPASRKLYYLQATVGGNEKHVVRFLVDSGAVQNILTSQFCEEATIMATPIQTEERVAAFTGQPCRVLGGVNIPVCVATQEKTIDFTVVESSVVPIWPTNTSSLWLFRRLSTRRSKAFRWTSSILRGRRHWGGHGRKKLRAPKPEASGLQN